MVSIGTEMLECFRQNKPLPVIFENDRRDDRLKQRIERIIKHMTEFRSIDRKNIQDVEEEYRGISLLINIHLYVSDQSFKAANTNFKPIHFLPFHIILQQCNIKADMYVTKIYHFDMHTPMLCSQRCNLSCNNSM